MVGEAQAPNNYQKPHEFQAPPGHYWEIPRAEYGRYGIPTDEDENSDAITLEYIKNSMVDFLNTYGADILEALQLQGSAPICDGNGDKNGAGRFNDVVMDGTHGIYVYPDGTISLNWNIFEQASVLDTVNGAPLYAVWMPFKANLPGYGPESYGFYGWGCASTDKQANQVFYVWASGLNSTVTLPDGRTIIFAPNQNQQQAVAEPTATAVYIPPTEYIPPPTDTPWPTQTAIPQATNEPLFGWLWGDSNTQTPTPTASPTAWPTATNTPISEEERQANADFNWFVYGGLCLVGGGFIVGIFALAGSRSTGHGSSQQEGNTGQYDEVEWVEEEPQEEWEEEPPEY